MTKRFTDANTEKMSRIEFVELDKLKPHEGVFATHLRKLREEIESDGILKLAIAISQNGNIILDGHHRVAALKELGCVKIPVVFVDYNSPDIEVQTRRKNIQLTKEEIIRAGMGFKKMRPKTSRHMIRVDGTLKHISAIEKRVDIPLEELRGIMNECDQQHQL